MNMMLHAMFSAPRPLRMTRPDTKIPIAQLVSSRLTKNAASARPRPNRLKPKNASASSATGIVLMASRVRLIDDQRHDELGRTQRADHQVGEVARPHLLEERERETELAAEQDVPQQHRTDED